MNSNIREINLDEMKEFTSKYLPSYLKNNKENISFIDLTNNVFDSISGFFNKLLDEKTFTHVKTFLTSHTIEIFVNDITISTLSDIDDKNIKVDLHNRRLLMCFSLMISYFEEKIKKEQIRFYVKLFHINNYSSFNDIILESVNYLEQNKLKSKNVDKIEKAWKSIDHKTFTNNKATIIDLLRIDRKYIVNKSNTVVTKNIEPFVSYHVLNLTCAICKKKYELKMNNKSELIKKVSNSIYKYYLFCKHDTQFNNDELIEVEKIDITKYKSEIDDNTDIVDFIIYNFEILKQQVVNKYEKYKKDKEKESLLNE